MRNASYTNGHALVLGQNWNYHSQGIKSCLMTSKGSPINNCLLELSLIPLREEKIRKITYNITDNI